MLKIFFKEESQQEELINLILLERMERENKLINLAISFLNKLDINICELEFSDGKFKRITTDYEIRFILKDLILKGEVCCYKEGKFYTLWSDGTIVKTTYPCWVGAQKQYVASYRRVNNG